MIFLVLAIAATTLIIYMLLEAFGLRGLGVVAAIGAVLTALLLFQPTWKKVHITTQFRQMTPSFDYDLARLTAEVTIDEGNNPPAAWAAETDVFIANRYPSSRRAEEALARHAIGPIAKAFSKSTDDLELSSNQAIIVLESTRHKNIAPSVLQKLQFELQVRFPDADIRSFKSDTSTNVLSFDEFEDLGLTGKETVLLSVERSPLELQNDNGYYKLSVGRDGHYHDAKVPFVPRSWVTNKRVGNDQQTRIRSQVFANDPDSARELLYARMADYLTEEIESPPYRNATSENTAENTSKNTSKNTAENITENINIKQRIRERLSDKPKTWLGEDNVFEQTLTTPDGVERYRMAVNVSLPKLDSLFASVVAVETRRDTLLTTAARYAALLGFVVVACFALKRISRHLVASNLAHLAEE